MYILSKTILYINSYFVDVCINIQRKAFVLYKTYTSSLYHHKKKEGYLWKTSMIYGIGP
jgi:hypothetical protein